MAAVSWRFSRRNGSLGGTKEQSQKTLLRLAADVPGECTAEPGNLGGGQVCAGDHEEFAGLRPGRAALAAPFEHPCRDALRAAGGVSVQLWIQ